MHKINANQTAPGDVKLSDPIKYPRGHMTVRTVRRQPSLHLCRDTFSPQQYPPVPCPGNYSSSASQAQTHIAIIHSREVREIPQW